MTFTLKLDEYHRLLALHRALMEAKFCEVPSDLPVSGSPFVADIANQVVEALSQWKKSEGGEGSWDEWMRIDPQRPEWRIAVLRAARSESWAKLDPTTKVDLSRNLLSPFTFDDELLANFIKTVDGQAPPRPKLVENRTERALEALNSIFVMLRYLAAEEKCSDKMFSILDGAELLPMLMQQGDYGYERFEDTLRDLAWRYPKECNLALQMFDRTAVPSSATIEQRGEDTTVRRKLDHRTFEVWSYSPSHKQLLLRSTKRSEIDKRIDILFTNVAVMNLPAVIRDVVEVWTTQRTIQTGNEADEIRRFYMFRGKGLEGSVLASTMTIHEDDKMFDEPSEIYPV